MSENWFKGDSASFGEVDIDGPIQSAREASCHYYVEPYAKAAKEAEDQGKMQVARTYGFLQTLVSFHPTFDRPEDPYEPWFQLEGRRGLVPADLTDSDIDAVRQLAPLAKDPALRARLHDVLWIRVKDHHACAEAARAYIKAAQGLDNEHDWPRAAECFKRSVLLAAKLGRKKEGFKEAAEAMEQAAQSAAGDAAGCRFAAYLKIVLSKAIGDPAKYGEMAEAFAKRVENDRRTARTYWQLAADFYHEAENSEASKNAALAAAETYVNEAAERASGKMASAMAAASLLHSGIEALRRAGAERERIVELRKQLTKYQKDQLGEMKSYSTSVDLSKLVEGAQSHVRGCEFKEALYRFTLGHSLTDLEELRKSVQETVNEHPLTHLFGATMMDSEGRPIRHKPSLLHLKGEELEKALEAEMFEMAAKFQWSMRARGFIEPARLQILNEHHPRIEDLHFLVQNNPFIPPGHEEIFLRGIHAGFHGDFVVAAHLLIPQIENSIRYVLESNGVDVSNLKSDMTQPVKTLGALFDLPATAEIFGEEMCFELRGCLIEKNGYDIRNKVAHGFITANGCASGATLTVWWLVLRLCLLPVFSMENPNMTETVKES